MSTIRDRQPRCGAERGVVRAVQWRSGTGQGPVMGGVGRGGAAAGDARGADLFIGIKADDCSVNKAGPDTWEGTAWSN